MTSVHEARWTPTPSSPIDELFFDDLESIFQEPQQASLFGAALSFERPEGLTILLILLAAVAFFLAFNAALVVYDHFVAAWRWLEHAARPPLLENYNIFGQMRAAAVQSAESLHSRTAGSLQVSLGTRTACSAPCTRIEPLPRANPSTWLEMRVDRVRERLSCAGARRRGRSRRQLAFENGWESSGEL